MAVPLDSGWGARSGHDGHDVFFAHHEQLFAVDLDGGARVLAEEDLVADLHVDGEELALVVLLAGADGHHFALVGLLGGGVGDHDAGGGLPLLFQALDDHAVMQRTQFHFWTPRLVWVLRTDVSGKGLPDCEFGGH